MGVVELFELLSLLQTRHNAFVKLVSTLGLALATGCSRNVICLEPCGKCRPCLWADAAETMSSQAADADDHCARARRLLHAPNVA